LATSMGEISSSSSAMCEQEDAAQGTIPDHAGTALPEIMDALKSASAHKN